MSKFYYDIETGLFFDQWGREVSGDELRTAEKAKLIQKAFGKHKETRQELFMEITGVPSRKYLRKH